jgi:hypothetical protein
MEGGDMATTWDIAEDAAAALRPVARWVHERDGQGRDRLAMRWSVPDPDAALTGLVTAEA